MRITSGVIALLTAAFIGSGFDQRRSTVSLKWLGNSSQLNGRGFNPERDSVVVPVAIVINQRHSDTLPTSIDSKNTSLLKLISKAPSTNSNYRADSDITNEKITIRDGNEKCPQDIDEWQIHNRFYNETKKCYIPRKGENPCPKNMEFYLIEGDYVYGECDCKIYIGLDYRPLVYWTPTNECFHLFDKGPCGEDEWLTLDSEQNSVCENRTCPTTEDPFKSWFVLNSTCHQLSTQAFCSSTSETVHYTIESRVPKCFDTPLKTSKTLLNGALTLPCKPGQKNYGSRQCLGEQREA